MQNQSYRFAGCCSSLDCPPSYQMCVSLAVPVGGNFHLAISALGPIAAGAVDLAEWSSVRECAAEVELGDSDSLMQDSRSQVMKTAAGSDTK